MDSITVAHEDWGTIGSLRVNGEQYPHYAEVQQCIIHSEIDADDEWEFRNGVSAFGKELDDWWRAFTGWLGIRLVQDFTQLGVTQLSVLEYGFDAWSGDEAGQRQTPSGSALTVVRPIPELVTADILRTCADLARKSHEPPTEWLLIRDARSLAIAGQPRRALLDAGTAAELALTAYTWSSDVLDRRGSGARAHRNMLVFLAADAARYEELQASVRDYLAWRYVRDNADGVLNLTSQQRQQADERLQRADRTLHDRLLGAYHWALVPTQPDPTRPLQLDAIKAEGSTDNLAERTAARLIEKSELVVRRAAAAIRLDLDTSLRSVFERDGHISLGTLWEYYTTYPYLARLRDRNVLEDGVLSTLDSPLDWEHQGFALADSWDGQNYSGLVLPTDPASRPATVDALLLVDPPRAEQQRQREIRDRPTEPGPGPGPHEPVVYPPPPPPPPPPPRTLKARFFGTATLNPDFYARDFGRITEAFLT